MVGRPRPVPAPPIMLRACLLAFALATPVAAQAASTLPTAEIAPADIDALAHATKLLVARDGGDVIVSWELPAGAAIKGIDIYRHTHESTKGRGRLDYVRPSPALFTDKVPDASADYWYWLKIVLVSGAHYNVGPVRTPDAVVWTP